MVLNNRVPLITGRKRVAPVSAGDLPAYTGRAMDPIPSSWNFAGQVTYSGPGSLTWSVVGALPRGCTQTAGVVAAGAEPWEVGTRTVTLRATAPGGAYVDVSKSVTLRRQHGVNLGNVTTAGSAELYLYETMAGLDKARGDGTTGVDFVYMHGGKADWSDFESGSLNYVNGLFGTITRDRRWTVPAYPTGMSLTLAAAANGDYNSHYATTAQTIVSAMNSAGFTSGPIWVRFAQEYNGSWYDWAAQTPTLLDQYKNFLIQAITTFRAQTGGSRFRFILGINAEQYYSGSPVDPTLAYPGGSYIDAIGFDFYHQPGFSGNGTAGANDLLTGGTWRGQGIVNWANSIGKPVVFDEWATRFNSSGSDFYTTVKAFIDANASMIASESYWMNNGDYASDLKYGQYPALVSPFISNFVGQTPRTQPLARYKFIEKTTLRNSIAGSVAGAHADYAGVVGAAFDASINAFKLSGSADDATRFGWTAGEGLVKGSATNQVLSRGTTSILKNIGVATVLMAFEVDAIPSDGLLYLFTISNGSSASSARLSLRLAQTSGNLIVTGRKNDGDSNTTGASVAINAGTQLGIPLVVSATLNPGTNQSTIKLSGNSLATVTWNPGSGSVFANTDAMDMRVLGLSGSGQSNTACRVKDIAVLPSAYDSDWHQYFADLYGAAA